MFFKIAVLSSLLVCSTYGFSFFHIFDDPKEIAPQVVCTGVANGIKLPDDTDCGHFYLCDSGSSLRLSCSLSVPHFDRCSSTCVNDPSVCTKTDCSGNTEAPTEDPTEDPTEGSTQASTESTTAYIAPTVPNACPTPCEDSFAESGCDCAQRWVCENQVCVCNEKIECPMTPGDCATSCGCAERCDCDPVNTDECFCKTNSESIQCPFNDTAGECVKNCGCQNNCVCTDTVAKTGCTCNATCSCIEPPKVCPFKPAECVATCGCQDRCLCNGDFCTCDGDNACPKNSFWKRH